MRTLSRRTKTAVRVGDWVKTERGRLLEVVAVQEIRATFADSRNYGPHYIGADGSSVLACAVVEVRRS